MNKSGTCGYSAGTKSSGPKYGAGKSMSKTAQPTIKVGYSAGKNMDHATNRSGDPRGAKNK